jgi:hypothetical protein
MVNLTSKPVVEFSVRWHDSEGAFKAVTGRPMRSVQLVLELKWTYGAGLPIHIFQREPGAEHPRWEPASWDELIAHVPERELPGLRVRQGWVEPSWQGDGSW